MIGASTVKIHILSHFPPSHIHLTTLSLQFTLKVSFQSSPTTFLLALTVALHFYSKSGQVSTTNRALLCKAPQTEQQITFKCSQYKHMGGIGWEERNPEQQRERKMTHARLEFARGQIWLRGMVVMGNEYNWVEMGRQENTK